MRIRPGSLRGRLVLTAALVTLLVMTVAAAIATWQIHAVTDRALTDAARTRLAAVRDGLSPTGALTISSRAQRTATYVQVLDGNGQVVASSSALAGAPPLLPLPLARTTTRRPRQLTLTRHDLDLAALGAPVTVRGRPGAVVVAVDSQGFLDTRQQLQSTVLLGVPLVVVLTALLTWLLTGRALRTVLRLAEDADALSVGESEQGLSVHTDDAELSRLVAALNRMLARLNSHYATNLAAAAETTHRLRTPLTTLRAEAELALLDDDPATTRLALERIVTDTDRLSALIEQMLSTAAGRRDVRPVDVAIAAARSDWERHAMAHGRAIEVHCDATDCIDTVLLRTVVDPLVENAVRHSAPGGTLSIEVLNDPQGVRVCVSNSGEPIPAELREQLFRPWTGRANGGLGLWLAREGARTAGGEVWCARYGPPQTQFVALLPSSAAEIATATDEAPSR